MATTEQIEAVKVEMREVVAAAVKFAEESPEPELSELFTDVLA